MERKTILKVAGIFFISALLLSSATVVTANKTNQTLMMSSPEKTYVSMNWTLKGGFGFTVSITNVGNTTATNLSWSYDINMLWGLILNGKTKSRTNLTLAPGETIIIKGIPIGIGVAVFGIDAKDSDELVGGVQTRFYIFGPFIYSEIHLPLKGSSTTS